MSDLKAKPGCSFSSPDADVGSRWRNEAQSTGIVHDLGNLIQVATSALNRVARDPSISAAPLVEPVLASARTALQRAGALVRETIGRAQLSRMEIEQTDVGACLAELKVFIGYVLQANISLEIRIAPDLPLAHCDHLGLQNAVLNLVFNARDAMPDGGLISIDATAVGQAPDVGIELRVEDAGIGMTAETMFRAFDPFFTTKGTGLGGVGLPMVKRFVEEVRGHVDIRSVPGSGTTVTLRLRAMQMTSDTRRHDR